MASLSDAVARPRVIINTNDIPSDDGSNVIFNRPLPLADAIEKQPETTVAPKVQSQPTVSTDQSSSDPEPSKVQAILDKLFGLHGQERYQLWPEKLARDALSAPHDVMTGQIPQYEVDPVSGEAHTSTAMIKAAQDVSALAGTGGLAGVGNEAGMALGSGPLKQAMVNTNKPFYSAVENALTAAKQPKADAQQWLSFLKNQPGVKQEELQHLGLDKLSGSITKDDLLKAVQEGQPQINVVTKGTSDEFPDKNGFLGTGGNTKYHSYQLPGGSNYREMLLTLPNKNKLAGLEKEYEDISKEYFANNKTISPEKQARWDELSSEIENIRKSGDFDTNAGNYRSSHWDEPNVLAHIRMNDRNIDGKKTLHVEEVQSDWHQAGRKQGYRGEQENKLESLVKQRDAIKEQQKAVLEKHGVTIPTGDARAEWLELADKISPIQTEINKIGAGDVGVPDAPFKKTWDELALKHIIDHAVRESHKNEVANWHNLIHNDTDRVAHALVKSGKLREICD